MFSWLLAAALALPATPTAMPVDAEPSAAVVASEPLPDPIPHEQVMALPEALRRQVVEAVGKDDSMPTLRFQRLMNFVVDARWLGMTYKDDATYTVSEAYEKREANCLTFTLMVLALAKEVGLEAVPQEVGETLSWREVDGTIYRDNHINAGFRIGGHRYTIDPAADLVFLPRPPVAVTQERLLAHYYNNVAVDRLQQGHMQAALADIAAALQLDPGYATLWSNAGVMYLHNGDLDAAEDAYTRALALDPNDASALFNMVQLLHRTHDRHESEFRNRLARVEQRDPLQQFLQALDYERAGNFPRAIASIRRAIQLKQDEHRFYAVLARLYQRVGDPTRARSALASAQALSTGQTRDRYRAERDRVQATYAR
ncbi:MAG: tetratricopeptide repeat protein [Luteimonas sp.]